MSLTDLLIPTYKNMLKALSGWLEKAQSQMPEAEALLLARLAPDMFPLSTQIRFACVQAQEAAHRLRGLPFPPSIGELLDEGRKAGESPGSIAEAQARISDTIALLEALPADALDVDRFGLRALSLFGTGAGNYGAAGDARRASWKTPISPT